MRKKVRNPYYYYYYLRGICIRIYGCSRLISWVLKIVCVRVEGVRVEGVRVEGVRVEGEGGGRSMDRIENNQLKRVPRSVIL